MNKLIVPVILTAVMVIGISFIMMPVEKAQTAHLTIQNAQLNKAGAVTTAQFSTNLNTDNITVTSGQDFVVSCVITSPGIGAAPVTVTDGTASGTFDVDNDQSITVQRAVNGGDTLTVSSTGALDALCTAMTTTAGTIIFG